MRPSTLPHTLSIEQVARVLEAAEGGTRVMVEVLYATGVRCAELVALEWADVDWNEHTIRVNKGKGNKDRIVLFGTPCRDALLRYRCELETGPPCIDAGSKNPQIEDGQESPSRPLQVNHRIFSVTTQSVQSRFRTLSRKVGFSVSPRLLRHAFCTGLMGNGADHISIMMLTGHAKVESLQVYCDVDPNIEDKGRVVADAMATVRGGITAKRLRRTITGLRWG